MDKNLTSENNIMYLDASGDLGACDSATSSITVTTNSGTTANIHMIDEAGQFPNLQYVNPIQTHGLQSKTVTICNPPTIPVFIGIPGDVFRDENNYLWVMSVDGWKQVVDNSMWTIEHNIDIIKEKGTKKKFKCF